MTPMGWGIHLPSLMAIVSTGAKLTVGEITAVKVFGLFLALYLTRASLGQSQSWWELLGGILQS